MFILKSTFTKHMLDARRPQKTQEMGDPVRPALKTVFKNTPAPNPVKVEAPEPPPKEEEVAGAPNENPPLPEAAGAPKADPVGAPKPKPWPAAGVALGTPNPGNPPLPEVGAACMAAGVSSPSIIPSPEVSRTALGCWRYQDIKCRQHMKAAVGLTKNDWQSSRHD